MAWSAPEVVSLIAVGLLSTGAIIYFAVVQALLFGQDASASAELRASLEPVLLARRGLFLRLLIVCILIGLAGFLATLPKAPAPPFSPGQTLGIGFLFGLLFALLTAAGIAAGEAIGVAALASLLPRDVAKAHRLCLTSSMAAATGTFGFTLLSVLAVLLAFRNYPSDALMGVALGASMVSFLMGAGADALGGSRGRSIDLLMKLVFAVALATALSVEHSPEVLLPGRLWWMFPVMVGALTLVPLFIASWLMAMLGGRRGLWSATVFIVVFIGVIVELLARYLMHFPMLSQTALCGLLSGLLLCWLTAPSSESKTSELKTPNSRLSTGVVCAAVVLTAVLVSFRLLSGYGVALCTLGFMALAALALGLSAYASKVSLLEQEASRTHHQSSSLDISPLKPQLQTFTALAQTLNACLSLLLGVLLFRLFYEKYPLTGLRADLYTHYTFIGLLVGAVAPFALAAWQVGTQSGVAERLREGGEAAIGRAQWLLLGRTLLLGFFCVALPLLVALLWGVKGVVGLLAGLIACGLFALVAALNDSEGIGATLRDTAGTALVGIGLVAVQFTHLIEPYSDIKRSIKIGIVVGLVAVVVIWMVVAGLRRRK